MTARAPLVALLDMGAQGVFDDRLELSAFVPGDLADRGEQFPVDLRGEFFASGGHSTSNTESC